MQFKKLGKNVNKNLKKMGNELREKTRKTLQSRDTKA